MSGNYLYKKERDELKETPSCPACTHSIRSQDWRQLRALHRVSLLDLPSVQCVDSPQVKPPSWEQPKSKHLSVQTAWSPRSLTASGNNYERSSQPVTRLGILLQFNSSTSPSAQPAFLLLTLLLISRAFPTGCVHANLLLRACSSVSKTVKGLIFVFYLQASKSIYHRFREAGRRHKNPWIKDKERYYFQHSS